jgi:hypothetical protein
MTTRGILNLLLLLGVAALAAVAIYQPGIAPTPPPVKLTALTPQQISRIHIERTGKDPLTLQKQDGHWRIAEPRQLPADDGRVNSLLRLVQETSQARFPAKPEDLHKYKLDKPAATLTLDDQVFAFGDIDPINGRRYVQLGTTVHLTTDMYFYQLDADMSSFVSTHLLPEQASISALTLPDIALTRDTQGHWQVQPDKPGLSADAIQTLVDAWRTTTALWVKNYAKGSAQGSITMQLKEPAQELHFDIMARQPELILARPDLGLQYHLSAESAKALLELPAPTQSVVPAPGKKP